MENTIVAISTAMGNGGIGIVRMSGDKAFEVLSKIFVPKNKNFRNHLTKANTHDKLSAISVIRT